MDWGGGGRGERVQSKEGEICRNRRGCLSESVSVCENGSAQERKYSSKKEVKA